MAQTKPLEDHPYSHVEWRRLRERWLRERWLTERWLRKKLSRRKYLVTWEEVTG